MSVKKEREAPRWIYAYRIVKLSEDREGIICASDIEQRGFIPYMRMDEALLREIKLIESTYMQGRTKAITPELFRSLVVAVYKDAGIEVFG